MTRRDPHLEDGSAALSIRNRHVLLYSVDACLDPCCSLDVKIGGAKKRDFRNVFLLDQKLDFSAT